MRIKMKKKKGYNYGKIYRLTNKNKRLIAGIIGGAIAFVMVMGVVASAFA